MIPKPILVQVGSARTADLQVRDGVIEIRALRRDPREAWADDARKVFEQCGDAPVWPEFANDGDDELCLAMKAGDICPAQLDTTVGGQMQKARPCVVISPEDADAHLRTVIVAPVTTGSRPMRFRMALTFQGKQDLILLYQVRMLERAPLFKRLYVLRPVTLAATLQTLHAMFAP